MRFGRAVWLLVVAAVVVPATICFAEEAEGTSTTPNQARLQAHVGVDAYLGASNLPTLRTYSDGFWAGSAAAFPSVVYARAENGTLSGKVSLGIGKLTTSSDATFRDPIEAWVQITAGSLTVTAGKFWVPFALQEWEYETKPGVMLRYEHGHMNLTAASTYCSTQETMNAYLRAGYRLASDVEVGVSGATGRGISYGTGHDRAYGVDLSAGWRGWRVTSEWLQIGDRDSNRAYFAFGRLTWERGPVWQPWIGTYAWNDRSGDFGRFRGTAYGVTCHLSPSLAIDAAIAPTSDQQTSWAQLHWTWER